MLVQQPTTFLGYGFVYTSIVPALRHSANEEMHVANKNSYIRTIDC